MVRISFPNGKMGALHVRRMEPNREKGKNPGGEWWGAAKDDVGKKYVDWADRVVQIEPLTAP